MYSYHRFHVFVHFLWSQKSSFYFLFCFNCVSLVFKKNTPDRNGDFSLGSLLCSFGTKWITPVSDACLLWYKYCLWFWCSRIFLIQSPCCWTSVCRVVLSHSWTLYTSVTWISEILLCCLLIWFTKTLLFFLGLHTLAVVVLDGGCWEHLPASSLLLKEQSNMLRVFPRVGWEGD